eukprot:14831463-Alexandrium_andersonii.AAC.1
MPSRSWGLTPLFSVLFATKGASRRRNRAQPAKRRRMPWTRAFGVEFGDHIRRALLLEASWRISGG